MKSSSAKEDMRSRAIQRVMSYRMKGTQYLPHVIDTTAQLTTSMLLDEAQVCVDEMNVRLSYMMSLIRFVNGVLDPTQQSQFAIPLHVLAKKVGLSSWFVDLRHWGTHERDLPGLDMLRMACKEALNWLWDHYWNDDELTNDSSDEEEDDEREESIKEEERMKRELEKKLSSTLQLWKKTKSIFVEERWVWESDNSVISSSNFVVEEENGTSNKKKNSSSLSAKDHINSFVFEFRELWRSQDDKRAFIRKCMENYDPILIQFLMYKLNAFDFELISWILTSYSNSTELDNKILKRQFNTWKGLRGKLLKNIVDHLNLKKLVHRWDQWDDLLTGKNTSYLKLWILQELSAKLQDSQANGNSWRKKKRKRQANNEQEVLNKISDHIDTLKKRFNESEMSVYDVLKSGPVESSPKVDVKNEVKDSKVNSILGDLANLKKRMNTIESKASNSESIKPEIKLWERKTDWEPTPIGVLR